MNPIIHSELMNARIADLHRQAERDRIARAAIRARRARSEHGRHPGPSRTVTVVARRMIAMFGARSLRPAR